MKKQKAGDSLGNDISHLLHVARKSDDSRIVPGDQEGGEKTIAAVHAINLLNIAESTRPEDSDTLVTPYGLSEKEYAFLDNLFIKFMGCPENWLLGRAIGYLALKYPDERKTSPGLQKYYSGFMDFFSGLSGISKIIILNEIDPELAVKTVEEHSSNPDFQEKAYTFLDKNKGMNWRLINNIAPFWMIATPEQYADAVKCTSEIYEPRIRRTEPAMKMIKGIVHEIVKDGKIDDVEKDVARAFLSKRFEGFDTLDKQCIDKMLVDISRKDVLFYMAMYNMLYGITPPSPAVKNEIIEVGQKANDIKELLNHFSGRGIDKENLHLVCYALQNIAGIRGPTNTSLVLADCGVSYEQLQVIGLHDVPEMQNLATDPLNYFQNCKIPGIKELVGMNSNRFYSVSGEPMPVF